MDVIGADPQVLYDPISKLYYCYATSGEVPFYVYVSSDLDSWEYVGPAFESFDDIPWAKDWFWAPECYYNPKNKHYYLFFSARVKDDLTEEYFGRKDYVETAKIGVAVSSSPRGPFKCLGNLPIDYRPYDPDYLDVDEVYGEDVFKAHPDLSKAQNAPRGCYLSCIDVNLFFDDDGRQYLYFSRCCYQNNLYDSTFDRFIEESNVAGVELEPDWWFDENASTPPSIKKEYLRVNPLTGRREDKFVSVIAYHNEPQQWENAHVKDYELTKGRNHNRRWAEGSTTFKIRGTYFITYSCNFFEAPSYGVGIAYAMSPLGPYKKSFLNPIIHQDLRIPIYSTGHGCIVEKDGTMYYLFHGRNDPNEPRRLFYCRLTINDMDNISVGPIVKCGLLPQKTSMGRGVLSNPVLADSE